MAATGTRSVRGRAVALVALIAAGAAAALGYFYTQYAQHVPRGAVIYPGSAPNAPGGPLDQFRQGLREAGYVEGKTVDVEVYLDDGQPDHLARKLAEWVSAPVDVIVAGATPYALAARTATRAVPIVFAISFDPVADGLVASLARPGGNATGLSIMSAEIDGKRFALLRSALPDLSRVAMLVDTVDSRWQRNVGSSTEVAKAAGIDVFFVTVRSPDDYGAAFDAAARDGAQAMLVGTSPLFARDGARLAQLAAERRIPTMFGFGDGRFANAGGLMSYGASIAASWRRAAGYVHRVLQGEKPENMPVEQPTRFELTINAGTAQRLGLTLPSALLVQADQVIK